MAKATTRKRAAKRPPPESELPARILETALDLAEDVGWEQVRLREVAARLGISMAELHAHYRDQDAVADAWFATAWTAMLAAPPEDFAMLPARERIHLVMMRWFDALAPRREVTGEMLSTKLYPSHPHHWVPLIFNLSRTIQWLRDAARLDAPGRRRQVEEVGLTGLFLATLAYWLRDQSEDQEATRVFLRHRLENADRFMAGIWGRRTPAET